MNKRQIHIAALRVMSGAIAKELDSTSDLTTDPDGNGTHLKQSDIDAVREALWIELKKLNQRINLLAGLESETNE